MRHVPTLLRRELGAYFLGPMAFLILLAFQVMAWLNFWGLVDGLSRPQAAFSGRYEPLNMYISHSTPFWVAMLVAVPALTMRLVAEERRSGTIEGLLTVPVTESEVVVSKWLAGVVMYLVLLLPFLVYLPFLYIYPGTVPTSTPGRSWRLLIGLTTIGMMFVAIGLFFSALTRNQIVAAIWTFVVMFLVVVLTMLVASYGAEAAGRLRPRGSGSSPPWFKLRSSARGSLTCSIPDAPPVGDGVHALPDGRRPWKGSVPVDMRREVPSMTNVRSAVRTIG